MAVDLFCYAAEAPEVVEKNWHNLPNVIMNCFQRSF